MDNELAVVESTAPSIHSQFDMVDVEGAKAYMDNYQATVEALLDKSDYQKIGDKQFKKKSAWRKLATAFRISDCIIDEEIVRDDTNQIVSAKYYVKARLPNGRETIGVGACSIYDKIRYHDSGKKKADATQPSNFELRGRFSNAEHDIPSTAHSRAKNRAISDLIGAGEVSAEEMGSSPRGKPKPVNPSKPVNTGKPKPVTPTKQAAKPKPEQPKEKVIEVEAEVKEAPKKSLKEIIDSNPVIRLAVDELQATESKVNRETIINKLLDLVDMGKVTTDEYKEAKAQLE